jgi:NAD(P)-dependent dehydrogenase (short-subunit alcohol dehydrogenase family)
MGLARAGAHVVLTGRRPGPLEESCAAIKQRLEKDAGGGGQCEIRATYHTCDITDYNQIHDLLTEAEYLTGIAPTILVNNAGINVRQKACDLTSDHWYQSLNVMLTAPFMLSRAMAKNMKEKQHGRIISITSLQSFLAFPDSIPYATAKSGVLGLTRALSETYSPPRGYENVTCNAVAPGVVETELTASSVLAHEERSQKLANSTMLGRNCLPDDIVGAVVFLASPAASYITGQTLPVDGGFTALGMR